MADLQSDSANLPPLMNPAMMQASDDLTNLSHLNEPAGQLKKRWIGGTYQLTAEQFSKP